MSNVLSPRDLVSRPDNMDETIPHTNISTHAVGLDSEKRIVSKKMQKDAKRA